jgi:hypothetical protein
MGQFSMGNKVPPRQENDCLSAQEACGQHWVDHTSYLFTLAPILDFFKFSPVAGTMIMCGKGSIRLIYAFLPWWGPTTSY